MVKSYQGARLKEEKEIKQYLVKDYMTKQLITFLPDQSMGEVIKTLTYRNISGGPVVNEKHELVGVLSEGDCLKQLIKGKYDNHLTLDGKVKDHMNQNVLTISPNATVLEAAEMFLNEKVRRFPVLDNGKLVGQVSQRDIMKAFEDMSVS